MKEFDSNYGFMLSLNEDRSQHEKFDLVKLFSQLTKEQSEHVIQYVNNKFKINLH